MTIAICNIITHVYVSGKTRIAINILPPENILKTTSISTAIVNNKTHYKIKQYRQQKLRTYNNIKNIYETVHRARARRINI